MAKANEWMLKTRATLLARLADYDDHKSWEDFFSTYSELIRALAIKMGLSHAEAADVVVETIETIAKQMPTFKYDPKKGSFRSLLFKTTRWRVVDQFRRRQGPLTPLEFDTPTGDDGGKVALDGTYAPSELEKEWDREWRDYILNIAIRKVGRTVNPKHFQMYQLYMIKEQPPETVADCFGTTVDQVYLAKHRVVEAIKKEVARLERELI